MPTHAVMAAGAFAALSVDLLIYPLDTLKTRIQAPSYPGRSPALFRGLYQGIGPVVVATLPASAVFFTTYEGMNQLLRPLSIATPVQHSFSSAVAECLSCAILCPFEVIKQNSQVASSTNGDAKVMAVFRRIPSVRALFSGYGALVARNLPFTALQFPLFEHIRASEKVTRRRESVAGTVYHNAVSAGIAAGLASVATTPADVVKTRAMLQAGDGGGQGYGAVIRDIWAKEGMRGLWKGGALRVVWMALGSGLYLGTYEGCKVWLGAKDSTGEAIGS